MRLNPTIIVAGSPMDGLTFHGPFVSVDAAARWAEVEFPDDDWWASTLWLAAPNHELVPEDEHDND